MRRAAVRDVELRAVTARIETVCPDTGVEEDRLDEGGAIDEEHATGPHVRDEEGLAVRRDSNVLRHASLGQLEIAEDLALDKVDLRQTALEFAGEDRK